MVGLCEARFTQDKYRDIVNGSSGEYRRARRFQVSPRVRTTAQELTEEAFTVPELTSAQLSEEFPGNEWLVADIYEKYKADKSSVDEKWAEIFARLEAASGSAQKTAPAQTAPAAPAKPAPQKTGQSAAPAAQKPAKSEQKASADKDTAAPPKPK